MGETTKEAKCGGMCGAVRFSVPAEPVMVGFCHCADCRRATGRFDHADRMAPAFHIWRSERLPWLKTVDHLPRYLRVRVEGMLESPAKN